MLDHMHLMDAKVQELCLEMRRMGGEVCDAAIPQMKVEGQDFIDAEQQAAKRRTQEQEAFDPQI